VQQQMALTTARVERTPVPERLRASGLAVFNGAFLERRHSRVEGWITELSVDDAGDTVEEGDLLYRIYSPALVSAQQEMLTALDSGETGLIAAAADRLRALGVSERTIANLRDRKRVLRELPFYSGQDGVVSELGIRRGSHVQSNDLLVAVGDPHKLWIEADLLERQVALVNEGDQAEVRFDALPGETWTGRISYIYPRIDKQTRSARVRVLLDNPDGRVMPGMFARVDIESAAGEPVLSIPRSALIRASQGDRVVQQVDNTHFRTVPVRAGRENGDRVVILEGLSEGDEVVTSAQFLIDSESARSGARLRMEGDHDQ
jgi:Cu(I)/Ag(I) efflux system membrane fusion protein